MMRHCKICGNEFAIKTINSVYCCRACAKVGKQLQDKKKHQLEVEANREGKLLRESHSVARKAPKRKVNISLEMPEPINSCFYCPLLGWQCRQSKFPLCRKCSGNLELMAAYNVTDVYS